MISREPPVPVLHPLNLQRWSNMTFVHWPCDAAILAPALPKGLAVDTCEGSPWVSMLPFVVEDLRSPFLPALPWLSTFPELNLRTYVRGPDNEPGIWFYSLDAARLPAVIGARLTYGLPYFWAKMRILHQQNGLHYLVKRRGQSGARRHTGGSRRSVCARSVARPGSFPYCPLPSVHAILGEVGVRAGGTPRVAAPACENSPSEGNSSPDSWSAFNRRTARALLPWRGCPHQPPAFHVRSQ